MHLSRQHLINLSLGLCALLLYTVPANAALVNQWTFDNQNATTATDSVGNLDGSLPTGATYVAPLTIGSHALDIAGEIDLRDGGTNTVNQTANVPGLTMTAWVNLDSVIGNDTEIGYFSVGGSNAARFLFGVGALNGSVRVGGRTLDSDSFSEFQTGASEISANQTYFLAAVIDYQNQTMRLHIDNKVINPGDAGTTFSNNLSAGNTSNTNSTNALIGESTFDGRIDDVRLYNTALTVSEVQAVIPEPSTLLLIGPAAMLLLCRRRGLWNDV